MTDEFGHRDFLKINDPPGEDHSFIWKAMKLTQFLNLPTTVQADLE
jgi:hypothetical protein